MSTMNHPDRELTFRGLLLCDLCGGELAPGTISGLCSSCRPTPKLKRKADVSGQEASRDR